MFQARFPCTSPRASSVLRLSCRGAAALAAASAVLGRRGCGGRPPWIPTWRPGPPPSSGPASGGWPSACWAATSPPRPTTGEPGFSSADSTFSMRVTGTSRATGAIPMAFSIWISPPPRSIRRSGCRSTPARSFAAWPSWSGRSSSLEDSGWAAGGQARPPVDAPSLPAFILELGANLLSSCPVGGVLLVGSDLEALSVWYDNGDLRARKILPVRPDRYATDSSYRRRMAEAMEHRCRAADPDVRWPGRGRRPLCLSPTADSAAAPAAHLDHVPAGPGEPPGRRLARRRSRSPSCSAAMRQGGSVWVRDVRGVYDSAARYNAAPLQQLPPRLRRRAAAGLSAVTEKDGKDGEDRLTGLR